MSPASPSESRTHGSAKPRRSVGNRPTQPRTFTCSQPAAGGPTSDNGPPYQLPSAAPALAGGRWLPVPPTPPPPPPPPWRRCVARSCGNSASPSASGTSGLKRSCSSTLPSPYAIYRVHRSGRTGHTNLSCSNLQRPPPPRLHRVHARIENNLPSKNEQRECSTQDDAHTPTAAYRVAE
jgi:hypothetical protein